MPLSPFVERTAELGVLREAITDGTRAVVIAGPPGVGKSRLLHEALDGTPAPKAMASPVAPSPFGVIKDLIGNSPDISPDASAGDLAMTVRSYVAALRKLSGPLVVEDLHWADADSLAVIVDLVRAPDGPVLLTTTREEPQRALADAVSALISSPQVIVLTLGGLSTGGVVTLMQSIWADRVPPRVALEVRRRTDGLPYWIEELARSARTPAELADRQLPEMVSDALCDRVDQAGPGARQLAEAASVLGDQVELSLLERVLGGDESTLRDQLQSLMAAEVAVPDTRNRVRFRHSLTREALASRVAETQRRQWHGVAYEALLRTGASRATLAWHAAQAELGGEAAETVLSGAQELISAGSGVEALRLAESILDMGGERTLRGAGLPVWRIHATAARAAHLAGWFDEAERHADRWRDLAEEARDSNAVADAECLRATLRWHAGDPVGQWAALDSALDQHGVDDGTRARVYAARSGAMLRAEQTEQTVPVADQALKLAERSGEHGAYRAALVDKGTALTELAFTSGDRAQRQEGLALLSIAERLSTEAGDSITLGRAINNGLAPRLAARPAAEQWLVWEESRRRATEAGLNHVLGTITRQGVEIAYDTAEWERGWRAVAARLPEETHPIERVVLAAHAALLAFEADRLDDAIVLADQCRAEAAGKEQFWKILYVALVDVVLATRTGPPELIVRALTRYRHAVARPDHLNRPRRAWAAARWALDAGVPVATVRGFLSATLPTGMATALADEVSLALAEAGGDHVAAISAGGRLLDQELRAVDRADVLTRLGRSLLQRGRSEEAFAYGDQARTLLVRWPGVRRNAAQALCDTASHTGAGLTGRERQVLDLVADGLSNREIAERLQISFRTVAVHVSRLLTKTGSSSRTQLAVRHLRAARSNAWSRPRLTTTKAKPPDNALGRGSLDGARRDSGA